MALKFSTCQERMKKFFLKRTNKKKKIFHGVNDNKKNYNFPLIEICDSQIRVVLEDTNSRKRLLVCAIYIMKYKYT